MFHRHRSHKPDTAEQLLTVVVTATAGLIVVAVHAADRWFAALFISLVTFSGIISYFKQRWHRKRFWIVICSALLVHVIVVGIVFGLELRDTRDVGFLICIPVIFCEAFVLYHAVKFFDMTSQGEA